MIASLLLAAAATFTPGPISAADKAEIIKQADQMMFDGPATRWDWPERVSEKIYCGKLNGKNRLGAYTGWRPFFFLSGKLTIPNDDLTLDLYKTMCTNAGYLPKD